MKKFTQLAHFFVKTRKKLPIFYDLYKKNRPYQ
jgi:hypothetical protein